MAYSKEDIEAFKIEIIEHISNGLSLKNALEINKHLPSRPIVYQWLNEEHKDYDIVFLNNYARACEERADAIFDEILEIADDSTGDVKVISNEGQPDKEVFNSEFAARSRIKIDARKWVLGRMKPKKYGEKLDLTSDGEKITAPSIPLVLSNGKTYDDLKNELKPE